MLIQITNRCHMGCPHCMQDSTPDGGMMSIDTYRRALDFAGRCGATVLLLSGGEPTEHPQFLEFAEMAIDYLRKVDGALLILSNGDFIKEAAKVRDMKQIYSKYANVYLQITSTKEYYKNYDFIQKYKSKILKTFPKTTVFDGSMDYSFVYQGRATRGAKSAEYRAKADANDTTISCLLLSQYAVQGIGLPAMVADRERHGKFCTPTVGYDGGIRGSESRLCPYFATVDMDFDEINRRMLAWRPCRQCYGWQKIMRGTAPKYEYLRKIFGV